MSNDNFVRVRNDITGGEATVPVRRLKGLQGKGWTVISDGEVEVTVNEDAGEVELEG